jgi:hypothetical protein
MAKQKIVIALQVVAEYDDSKIKPEDFGGREYFAKHIIDNSDIDGMELDAGEDEWVTLTVAPNSVVATG